MSKEDALCLVISAVMPSDVEHSQEENNAVVLHPNFIPTPHGWTAHDQLWRRWYEEQAEAPYRDGSPVPVYCLTATPWRPGGRWARLALVPWTSTSPR